MKPFRRVAALLLFFVAYVLVTNACGPFFPEAVFVQTSVPDGDYAEYLKGHLGVIQPGYHLRYLVVAYDWLNGAGLTAAEQEQALALEHFDSPIQSSSPIGDPPSPGLARWLAVRHAYGLPGEPRNTLASPGKPAAGPAAFTSDTAFLLTDRKLPGDEYQSFPNCLDDAFATAANTLTARKAAHTADAASLADWLSAQDAVFVNCAGGNSTPPAAPAEAPLWLRQDRLYQQAAANFYRTAYDNAAQQFGSIAADRTSPWRQTARFLLARTAIRRATVGQESSLPANLSGQQHAPYSKARSDALQAYRDTLARERAPRLRSARMQLQSILDDPSMATFHHSAAGLLDLIDLQLDPQMQAEVLTKRLTAPNRSQMPGTFRQALVDLHVYRSGSGPKPPSTTAPAPPTPELLAWTQAMAANTESPFDSSQADYSYARQARQRAAQAAPSAIAGWRLHQTTPWLVAAVTAVQPGDPALPELLRAIKNLPATSPARLTVTYHRLRLAGPTPEARDELLRLLPALAAQHESRSTLNLFTMLLRRTAPSFSDFLQTAASLPTTETDEDEDYAPLSTEPVESGLCRTSTSEADTPLFDHESATILNTRLPLRLLAEAAGNAGLPANLRFQIAQSAWTRAVLLGRPEVAKALSPLLTKCYASWQPVLGRYDAAATAADREAEGLLALMRFSSNEPVVRDGMQRVEGFATYSDYRDNWWPPSDLGGPPAGSDSAHDTGSRLPSFFGTVPAPRDVLPDPAFLSAEDRAAADGEIAMLRQIPCASDYFALSALAWQQAHPRDRRTADILGNAERVIRNGCSTKMTPELSHRLFTLVQTRYPESEWASKYTTWQ